MNSNVRGTMVRKSPPRGTPSSLLPSQGLKSKRCPRDSDCACFSGKQKPIALGRHGSNLLLPASHSLLHMDGCSDPECMDLEQLNELQKSLDRFTDYDHYERCCDGHHPAHHHHHLVRHGDKVIEECCDRLEDDEVCTGAHRSPSNDCDDCEADCEECVDDHSDCFEQVDVCQEDCDQCEEECEEMGHERESCPQDHPTTRDNCVASCDIPLPLLGPTNDFDVNPFNMLAAPTPCTDDCHVSMVQSAPLPRTIPEAPFDTAMDHWQTFVQSHHCAPDPCLVGQLQTYPLPQHLDPSYGFSFGCDPTIPTNQYDWQNPQPHCTIPLTPVSQEMQTPMMLDVQSSQPSVAADMPTPSTSVQMSSPASVVTGTPSHTSDRTCQWVMPCGSACGAKYTRTEDLKKHVKNSHGTKGTVTCGWRDCTASFASEAALTGHISKKHLSFDEEGPWKCTFPNCTKSFMYKQVRDEHVASHTGGNRMHCPICHQWLNAEGSNFRRHMASHGPKHEHMKCKFEHLGCKRRFPRVDNLRRHEACCKFGKKVQGVHHHHHRIHNHAT